MAHRMPRLTLALAIVALLAVVFGATYALRFDPELLFWKEAAARKLSWVEQMRAKHGHVIGVVGGSTTTFGIDAELIEREYNLPVANLGLHAGMGPITCVGFGLASLQKGDTLIVSLEPGLLTDEDTGTTGLGTRFAYAMGKPEYLHWMQEIPTQSRLADLTMLMPGGRLVVTMLGKVGLGIPLYRYSLVDTRPGGLQVTDERRDFIVDPADSSGQSKLELSPAGAELLTDLRTEAEQRGIHVVYVLPWAYSPAEVAEQVRQANINYLDQVESIVPVLREQNMGVHSVREDFADSGQHLTEIAARKRSHRFVATLSTSQ
jgi:hypothetical protein